MTGEGGGGEIWGGGGSGSGKANSLFNLIHHQPDIDKMYLYGKDPYETKYHLLINKRESTGLKHLNDSKAFTEYSNKMIWVIFMKILKNKIHIKNAKYLSYLLI